MELLQKICRNRWNREEAGKFLLQVETRKLPKRFKGGLKVILKKTPTKTKPNPMKKITTQTSEDISSESAYSEPIKKSIWRKLCEKLCVELGSVLWSVTHIIMLVNSWEGRRKRE